MTRVVARWDVSDNVTGHGQAEALVQDPRRSNRTVVGTSDGMKPFSCPGGPVSGQFRTTMYIIFAFALRSGCIDDFGQSAQGNSRTPHLHG